MWVSCSPLPLTVSFSGESYTSSTTVFVSGRQLDVLDIANMPEWGSIIHMYQQVNASGPYSSLAPWIVVMLARDRNDGTANFPGVAVSSVTYLGNTILDLHGYGPVVEGLLGAAAECTFRGETSGTWPDVDVLWPPLNNTPNVVFGTVVDDRPTLATALLNYGPSWQYNPVSENDLPGGSVSYIANNTGADVPFEQLFASYVRNQWALMAYAITPQAGLHVTNQFAGSGPNQLFITVTLVGIFPAISLVIGVLAAIWAWAGVLRNRRWVNRVEFESWWIVKAARPDFYDQGYADATAKDFDNGAKDVYVRYNGTYLERYTRQ